MNQLKELRKMYGDTAVLKELARQIDEESCRVESHYEKDLRLALEVAVSDISLLLAKVKSKKLLDWVANHSSHNYLRYFTKGRCKAIDELLKLVGESKK